MNLLIVVFLNFFQGKNYKVKPFILKFIKLINFTSYSVWKELSPLYDTLSDITLPLLMRIIWTDSRFFLASVSKVFEHHSWEVR